MSSWILPSAPIDIYSTNNIKASRIDNTRVKVTWSESGIKEYQLLVRSHLLRLQSLWLESPTKSCLSLFIQSTNHILTSTAAKTNKTKSLASYSPPRSQTTPNQVKKSQKSLLQQHRNLNSITFKSSSQCIQTELKCKYYQAKSQHQRLVRMNNAQDYIKRDEKNHTVLSSNPSDLYKSIRNTKSCRAGEIQRLTVRDRTYLGENVADGFYDSLSNLKSIDPLTLEQSPSYTDFSEDFDHILEICYSGDKIPQITPDKSREILMKIKPMVCDLYSMTATHYINAGEPGILHFHLLLSALIEDVSNLTITEINAVYANILFKGHNKDKSSDRSYRTISICPLIVKALDLYIRELNINTWNKDQADVQFLGEGSSHELAALLLTETIQSSLYTDKQPLFALFVDARSAYDVVLRKIFVNNLFHCGTEGHSLLYINNRLETRTTVVEWDKQLMGPIMDERGFEQGGASSGDYYKIYGKEQLTSAQSSGLGVRLGKQTISAIGLADDTVLVANCLHSLFNLFKLCLTFCSKYHVELCIDKTKLVAISTPAMTSTVEYAKLTSPLSFQDKKIPFSHTAEHVGILRNEAGNLPNIMNRIKAHQKALGGVLHAGLARNHRGNPAASIRIEKLYAAPVLMSGIGALVLLKSELNMIDHHVKETLERLMRLHPRTPQCVVAFLSGCLPGTAQFHQRMFSLFAMICDLKDNVLHKHAMQVLVEGKPSSKSWFIFIRDLCLQYGLPHPLTLLQSLLSKEQLKTVFKKQILNYWEIKLRTEASSLPSLKYFHPHFMNLTKTHPVWTSAGSCPYQVAMCTVQATMMTGRYRTELLCSKWAPNSIGSCLAPSCISESQEEDLHHILAGCESLEPTRLRLANFTAEFCLKNPIVQPLIHEFCSTHHPQFCQFLIDCSVLPAVITASQFLGPDVLNLLFRITRTWCYCLHKKRLQILGRWKKF